MSGLFSFSGLPGLKRLGNHLIIKKADTAYHSVCPLYFSMAICVPCQAKFNFLYTSRSLSLT